MKNYTQVYVKGSFEATEMYCKAKKLKALQQPGFVFIDNAWNTV